MSVITKQKTNNGEKLRKVFYYENNREKPILAGGVIFIKEVDGKKYLLMQDVLEQNGTRKFSDFGGKIDVEDPTLIHTIAREFGEETNFGVYFKKNNNELTLNDIKKLIQKNIEKAFYQSVAKYFIIFVKFNPNIELDMEKIGDHEKLDKIERKVEWIPIQQYIDAHFNGTLHPRLWGKNILEYLGYKDPNKNKFAFKNL